MIGFRRRPMKHYLVPDKLAPYISYFRRQHDTLEDISEIRSNKRNRVKIEFSELEEKSHLESYRLAFNSPSFGDIAAFRKETKSPQPSTSHALGNYSPVSSNASTIGFSCIENDDNEGCIANEPDLTVKIPPSHIPCVNNSSDLLQ